VNKERTGGINWRRTIVAGIWVALFEECQQSSLRTGEAEQHELLVRNSD